MVESDEKRGNPLCCAACGRPIRGDSIVYRIECEWFCPVCTAEYMEDNIPLFEVADAFGIRCDHASEVLYYS